MRKRYKQKKHSCALCKPFKMGWAKRFKDKELIKLKEAEKEIRLTTVSPNNQRGE